MFVNSGSEANDLAWRLSTAATGRGGAIVTANAYHGMTAATTDLSPEGWAPGTAPPHVETVPAPDAYRGPYRADDPAWVDRYAAHVPAAGAALAVRGHDVGVCMLDPAFTSDGIHFPPAGYLRAVVDAVRDAGAIIVVDEVQTGYGRTGSDLWGFAASEVTPDIVTLGKPAGNGYPLGVVVTRAGIAEAFARTSEFFSTFGGNPVACAAGLAVLEVIEEEALERRAAEAGRRLIAGLRDLASRHPPIGDVRGAGLLIGVELVDGDGRPSRAHADAVMNGMRDRGVLIGTTGADGNVLKIRPPLVISDAECDLLLSTLDDALDDAAATRPGSPSSGR
jgi:4-aminobutyrate aminotransferase-like enzyme